MQILGLAMHYPVKLASVSAGDGTGHDSFGSHGGFHGTPKLMIYNLIIHNGFSHYMYIYILYIYIYIHIKLMIYPLNLGNLHMKDLKAFDSVLNAPKLKP